MPNDDLIWGYLLALVAYGGLGGQRLWQAFRRKSAQGSDPALTAAVWLSAGWAATAAWALAAPGIGSFWLTYSADLLRYGAWVLLLVTWQGRARPWRDPAMLGAGALLLVTWAVPSLKLLGGAAGAAQDGVQGLESLLRLAVLLVGLFHVEQLFRGADEARRWRVKPLCLGLGLLFVFDLYLQSEVLLFGRADSDALRARGFVHALAVPLLYLASARAKTLPERLKLSRVAAFHSATFVLAGAYLLAMAAVGYYVRYFGGTWGRALQIVLLVAGGAFLLLLVFSGAVRSWLKVFLSKHFYNYRYDYREEWLRFTTLLSTRRSPQETGEVIVQGLARMVECPSGSLWSGASGHFDPIAAWNTDLPKEREPTSSSLCRFLTEQGWVVDMSEFRSAPRRYEGLVLPLWLLSNPKAWLVVPLLAGEELVGFVVLNRPLTTIQLNWEVLDLLKTAGRQAASYLAQMHATEALLEARKFDAFNRMSAFVVHDLKNIVAQLSLMLKNAERLHDNPEFQEDMRLTVHSSLEKMKRMMLQLREGAAPPGGSRGVELASIALRLQRNAKAQGRYLEVDVRDRLSTRGHEERLERVLGHLVQNAFDATPPDGHVGMVVRRHGGQVMVEVSDSGCGMTEAFVRTQLFRPFSSSKPNGMGIGSYESRQYIEELGGHIAVDSEVGRGTVMSVVLPLLDTTQDSDLAPLSTS